METETLKQICDRKGIEYFEKKQTAELKEWIYNKIKERENERTI
jgi:hypothetical protein